MKSMTDQNDVLKQFSFRRILLPILIGLVVVLWMFFRDFDAEQLSKINWTFNSAFWLLMGAVFMIVRHFLFMYRLKVLTNHDLNWRQCFDLVSLWEFSSCATPSSVGGTAIALFLLTKEKISAGRTTTIVLVTIFMDGLFFTLSILIVWSILGALFLSPDIDITETILNSDGEIGSKQGWAYFFFVGFFLNILYFLIVAYGLFVNPKLIQWLINAFFKLPFVRRWKDVGEKTGKDLLVASKGLKNQTMEFWVGGTLSTFGGWIMRLGVVNCVLLAVVYNDEQLLIWARSVVIYLVMVLSPTPGSSGAAEGAFTWVLDDFMPSGIGPALALIWRIFTYYLYIIVGVFVLPQWIRRVFRKSSDGSTSSAE